MKKQDNDKKNLVEWVTNIFDENKQLTKQNKLNIII